MHERLQVSAERNRNVLRREPHDGGIEPVECSLGQRSSDLGSRPILSVFYDPLFREKVLAPQMFEPITSTPEQFAEFIRTEAQKWGKVARDAKLKVD